MPVFQPPCRSLACSVALLLLAPGDSVPDARQVCEDVGMSYERAQKHCEDLLGDDTSFMEICISGYCAPASSSKLHTKLVSKSNPVVPLMHQALSANASEKLAATLNVLTRENETAFSTQSASSSTGNESSIEAPISRGRKLAPPRQHQGADVGGRKEALLGRKGEVNEDVNGGELVLSDKQRKEKMAREEQISAENKVNRLRSHFYSKGDLRHKRFSDHHGSRKGKKATATSHGAQKPHLFHGPPRDRPAGLY